MTADDNLEKQRSALPFTCPSCYGKFGTGADIVLLSIFREMGFRENLPCCGVLVRGIVRRTDEGTLEIKEMELL